MCMYSEIVGNAITCLENNALGPTHVLQSSCWGLQHCLCHEGPRGRNWWHVGTCSDSEPQCCSCDTGASLQLLPATVSTSDCSQAQPVSWADHRGSYAIDAVYEWLWMFAFPGFVSCFSNVENCHLSGFFWASLTSRSLEQREFQVPEEILGLAEKRVLGNSLV